MQYDFNKTSMSNNRGRWSNLHRSLGVSALAALGCFSTAASAIETDFGVDYRATGFYVHSDAFHAPPATTADGQVLDSETNSADNDNGFAHYIRLKADFKHESGVELHTSIELAGDRWVGEDHANTGAADQRFSADRGDNVRLDLGFVQFPLGKTLIRVGRQESNWNNCFTSCDDRRDRIIALRRFGNVSAFIGYDRRQDNAPFYNADNGDQIFPGFVAPLGDTGWQLGFLYVHYLNSYSGDLVDTDPALIDTDGDGVPDAAAPGSTGARNVYVLSNGNLFAPYVMGSLGAIDIEAGLNYFRDGNVENNTTFQDGDFFSEESWAEYFRIGTEIGIFEAKAQFVGAQDGGLIAGGFDTYSSLINSNPDATNNPTSVYKMGNLGREGLDQSLYIASLTANITPKFALRGAVGVLDIDTPGNPAFAFGGATEGGSDSSMVYDVEASYQINEALRTWATLGMLESNDVGQLTGNSLIGGFPNGGSFADEDVLAGSANLGVTF